MLRILPKVPRERSQSMRVSDRDNAAERHYARSGAIKTSICACGAQWVAEVFWGGRGEAGGAEGEEWADLRSTARHYDLGCLSRSIGVME